MEWNIDKMSISMDIFREIIKTKNSKNNVKLVDEHFIIFKQVNMPIIYIMFTLMTFNCLFIMFRWYFLQYNGNIDSVLMSMSNPYLNF